MVIASIDIQAGRVVQLRQGSTLVLQRDDPQALAADFDQTSEVAVIDLDAATGAGSNRPLILPLLRLAECRVGGGIRTPEQARELVSLGARKIILGSAALRLPGEHGGNGENNESMFGVNAPLLEAVARAIGRERVIVAVDARPNPAGRYEILVDGWKTRTGLDLIDTARAVEPYASELLFTCVEREGGLAGINLDPVRALRDAVSCRLTAAGGVTTLDEITALAAMNVDAQLGMALYTGRVTLPDAFAASLNWTKAHDGLLPLIAQSPDGQVLMTGFTDRQALAETFRRRRLCFHSRARNTLWMKGEQSGNTLDLIRLRADCDRDALLATVAPAGPVCHTGAWTCFDTNRRYTLQRLQDIIADRFRRPTPGSYTATLDDELVREKVREEAAELCDAPGHDEIIWEAADLLYFTTALLTRAGVTIDDVLNELDRRHKQ